MPSDSRKRKSIDNFLDDSPEPVLKKRNKANSSDRLNVEKPAMMEDEQGHPYWELSSKRRLALSEYKGNTTVAVREYYEKDGKLLPGKSGINLTMDQLSVLVLALPELTATLAEKGFTLPRPNYDAGGGDEADKKAKRNFDATSDEEE